MTTSAPTPNAPWLIGVDEVGRGPIAGPLYVCAAAFSPEFLHSHEKELVPLTDSKKYRTHEQRKKWATKLRQWAEEKSNLPPLVFSLRSASVQEIKDATTEHKDGVAPCLYRLMMETARDVQTQLAARHIPSTIVIDGNFVPPTFAEAKMVAQSMIKADAKVKAVSAASVIAKVEHDEEMAKLHTLHPLYKWNKNQGYCSREHDASLLLHGLTPHHRPTAQTRLDRLRATATRDETDEKTKEVPLHAEQALAIAHKTCKKRKPMAKIEKKDAEKVQDEAPEKKQKTQ